MSLHFTAFSSRVYITSLFVSDVAANRQKKRIGIQTDTGDRGVTDTSRKNNYLSLKDKAEILQRLDHGAQASNLAREFGISNSQPSHDLSSEKR